VCRPERKVQKWQDETVAEVTSGSWPTPRFGPGWSPEKKWPPSGGSLATFVAAWLG